MEIEIHPLEPFLPAKSKLLMLGSFPPQKKRWSIEFYYPNLNNDMWRIYGILFFNDKNHFLNSTLKSFCREQIIDFLNEKGIALFDTASSIRRLQDNASDKFLEVVEATDVAALLRQLPECKAIVTTGQKATDTLRQQFDIEEPKVGDYSEFVFEGRAMRHALIIKGVSISIGQESSRLPDYVSGFTDIEVRFKYQVLGIKY